MGGPTRKHGPRTIRGLGPEERALWDKVTRDATPLPPERRKPVEDGDTGAGAEPASPKLPATDPATAADRARPGARPHTEPRTGQSLRPTGPGKPHPSAIKRTATDLADRALAPVGRPEAGLDRRNAERLRRGVRAPDGRIDLHGMTADRAHRTLDRYIAGALARGERLVLVITGKGGKSRNADDAPYMRSDQGLLRQQAPQWLRTGPNAGRIVGIYQAHPRHGGAGAFYVYLKKRR